jgi:hypothetical protein
MTTPDTAYEAARLAAESCYRDRTGLTPQSEQHYVHTYATAAADAVWPLAFEAGRRQRWEELAQEALADVPPGEPDEAPALHGRAVEVAHRVLAAESISEFTAGVAEGRRQAAEAIRATIVAGSRRPGFMVASGIPRASDYAEWAARLAEGKDGICSCPDVDVTGPADLVRGERAYVKGYSDSCPVHGLDGTEPLYHRRRS